jgi:hypothetical protein
LALSAGPVPLFVHDRSSITNGSGQEHLGCRPFLGKLVTFSVPAQQPDGSYQVVIFGSYGCSGSADLVEVAYIDGQFQVTNTRMVGSWTV